MWIKLFYGELNHLIKRQFANGVIEKRNYNNFGKIESIKVYDKSSLLIWKGAYMYNDEAQLIAKVNDKAELTRYEYDEKYQVSKTIYPTTKNSTDGLRLEISRAGFVPTNDLSGEDVPIDDTLKQTCVR